MRLEELIGARIATHREGKMTQAELGERVGRYLGRNWSRQTVSAAEKGGRAFTALELLVISIELDVPLNVLFLPQPTSFEGPEGTLETPGGQPMSMKVLLSQVLRGPEQEGVAEQYSDTNRQVIEMYELLEKSRRDLKESWQDAQRDLEQSRQETARERAEWQKMLDELSTDALVETVVQEVIRRMQHHGAEEALKEGAGGEGTDPQDRPE